MSEKSSVNKDCPCKRTSCARHGNCYECKKHHDANKRIPPVCLKKATKVNNFKKSVDK